MDKSRQRIIRKPKVLEMIGVSDVTIWRWEGKGEFPRRLQLGSNSCGWLESEILEWIENRAAKRGGHDVC